MAKKKKKAAPWAEWKEAWVCPVYGGGTGCPEIVLAYSVKHAFEKARMHWPTATGWKLWGLVDPDDRECVLEGSIKATQYVVTRELNNG